MLALGSNARGRAGLLAGLKPQDVFATSLYTGTGAAQTITNGLDLAGKGGLVWGKNRSGATRHGLFDTSRGAGKHLASDRTDAEAVDSSALTAFNSSGFSLGADDFNGSVNSSGSSRVAWSFRRATKFFDIVTYTGDGTSGRQIPHGLGVAPGMIITKRRSAAGSWQVYHRSRSGEYLQLETTGASNFNNANQIYGDNVNPVDPTSSVFSVGSQLNISGVTHVAYLFAHDPDTANGIVQCGSFTEGPGSGATVNLGWNPQFVLIKSANNAGNWYIVDTSRGIAGGNTKDLNPNTSAAEGTGNISITTSATGFNFGPNLGGGAQWVYLAIRAPI